MLRFKTLLFSTQVYNRLSVLAQQFATNMNVSSTVPTAGIIVIGDEILKGQVQDTNSHFLAKRLYSLGVKVQKVLVIGDELDTIAREVAHFSAKYTHVITTGGIGPTHDDVTFEGVARAFGEGMQPHPELVEVCRKFFGTDDLSSPMLKLAHVPVSARLHYGVNPKTGERHKYPLVTVRNVFVFPGIPSLLETAFTMLEELFRNPAAEFHMREVYIAQDELSIAAILNDVRSKFKDTVTLGSYPEWHNSYYRVKLTVESASRETTDEACAFISSSLPPGSVVSYDKDPVGNAPARICSLLENGLSQGEVTWSLELRERVREAVGVMEQCLDKYRLEEVCVGFNGGKDCTALLHLVYAVVARRRAGGARGLQALYIRRGQPFPEIELFVRDSAARYGFRLVLIEGRIKNALAQLRTTHPDIKAVLMGTRATDPHAESLSSFAPTDADWPPYMRVNPLLHWSYSHVWAFLRALSVPYCPLYDRGYTSLGSMENTHPNPRLQQVDSRGVITYRPAHQLNDSQSERSGRN